MIEPDFGASEVRFLIPDIRLERCECTARTGGGVSTSYLGDAGIKTSGYGDTKQRRHKQTCDHTPISVSGIRPSRLFFVAQLVVVKMSRSRMRRGDLSFQMR
jgi:hypothetical protein